MAGSGGSFGWAATRNARTKCVGQSIAPHGPVARLLEEFSRFSEIGAKQNQEFIDLVNAPPEVRKKFLFFEAENTVLKEINDKLFSSKDIPTALTNVFKKFLHDAITADPVLGRSLVGAGEVRENRQSAPRGRRLADYSDFKAMRYIFRDPPGIEVDVHLNAAYQQAVSRFVEYWNGLPYAHLLEGKAGLVADPRTWFLAGSSRGAPVAGLDPASQACRNARTAPKEGEIPRVRTFSQSAAEVAIHFKLINEARQAFQGRVIAEVGRGKPVEGMLYLVPESAGLPRAQWRYTPSLKLTTLVRKAIQDGALKSPDRGLAKITQLIKQEFAYEADPSLVGLLTGLIEGVDSHSASLVQKVRINMDLSGAPHGIYSVDLKNQGGYNLLELMAKLSDPRLSEPGMNSLKRAFLGGELAREAERTATQLLRARTANLTLIALKWFGHDTEILNSGDDFLIKPKRPISERAKVGFFRDLAGIHLGAEQRPVDLARTTYAQDGLELRAEDRSKLIVGAENLEKKIQLAVASSLPAKVRDTLLLEMRLDPIHLGRTDLLVTIGGPPDGSVLSAVRAALVQLLAKSEFQDFHLTRVIGQNDRH